MIDTTITPLDDALRPFSAAHLRLTLRPENVLRLPPQQGSTVRGALAASVKGLVCTRRDLRECGPCPEVQSCAYPYLFETSPPPGVSGTRGYEQFPRPYIISYPAPAPRAHTGALEGPVRGANTESSPGRRRDPGLATQSDREIGLTLVGQAVQFFPYLALALRDLENKGLGRGRGRFELVRVDALEVSEPWSTSPLTTGSTAWTALSKARRSSTPCRRH